MPFIGRRGPLAGRLEMRRVFIPGDEIMVVFSYEKMRDMGFDDPTILQ